MKKFLCLALVLLLLLPMTIACKKDEQGGEGTGSGDVAGNNGGAANSGTDTDPSEKYNFNILDTLPPANYGGKEFKVSMEEGDDHVGNFLATEITGDLANDTLYRWLTKIENTYNTKVKVTANRGQNAEYCGAIKNELATGNADYHLYGVRAYQAWQCALENLYLDWNSLSEDWINLDDADRWDVYTNESVTFNGKFFTATGDLGVSKLKKTMATFYHVELLERFGADNGYDQDYIYGLVDEGDWTLEAMTEIVKDVYEDTDRDGARTSADIYGYYSQSGNSYDMWVPAMGITSFTEDENGRPDAVLNTPENLAKLAKVRDFYFNNRGVMNSAKSADVATATNQFDVEENDMFVSGNALLITTTFASAYADFQKIGTQAYGIMPQPKYDDDQEEYMSYINDQYDVWAINVNLAKGDEQNFAAHITDALCAESANAVYYQFYDILLKQRYSKDKATAGMVDKVMENVLCDATRQYTNFFKSAGYTTRGYTGIVRTYFCDPNYDFETNLRTYESALDGAALDKMFEAYQ